MLNFYDCIGLVYSSKNQIEKALENFTKALELAIADGDLDREASIYLNLGNLYSRNNDFTMELDYYIKALTILEKTDDKRKNQVKILTNISNIHLFFGNRERALYYIDKAKPLTKTLFDEMLIYYHLGYIYEEIEQKIENFQKAYEMAAEIKEKGFVASCLNELAYCYSVSGDYDMAMEYTQMALPMCEELGDLRLIYDINLRMMSVYGLQGNWKATDVAASKVLDIDSTFTEYTFEILHHLIKSNIYLENKDKAVTFLEKLHDLVNEDQKYGNIQELLAEMEVKYETEKKDMQIASLEKERKLYFWLGIAGVLLALALSLCYCR